MADRFYRGDPTTQASGMAREGDMLAEAPGPEILRRLRNVGTTEVDPSSLAGGMRGLETLTTSISGVVDELERRIAPIVRVSPPTAEERGRPVRAAGTPLASAVLEVCDRLAVIDTRLRQLTASVDL